MAASRTLIGGDDIALSVQLKKDGAVFNIPNTATVKAMLHDDSPANLGAISSAVTCIEGAPGADWAQSLVVVEFTSAESTTWKETYRATLEIEVDDNGKTTWRVNNFHIDQGYIT